MSKRCGLGNCASGKMDKFLGLFFSLGAFSFLFTEIMEVLTGCALETLFTTIHDVTVS